MIEFLEARIAPAVVLNKAGLLTAVSSAPDLVAVDQESGDIFVVGSYVGIVTPNFDGTNPVTSGDAAGDLYIAKYAPDFTLLWANSWGGTGPEVAKAITVDSNGDLFIAGNFSSTNAAFAIGGGGTASTTNGATQAFILKVNGTNGHALTTFNSTGALTFGNGVDPSSANALTLDSNGNLVIGGEFTGNNNSFAGQSFGVSSANMDGFLGRVNASTGSPDSTFGNAGALPLSFTTETLDTVFKVQIGPNGDFFAGLRADGITGGTSVLGVMRLDSSTLGPVSSFGGSGFVGIAANIPTDAVDFTLDNVGNVIATQAKGTFDVVVRFNNTDGQTDNTFGQSGAALVFAKAGSVHILPDNNGGFYLGGETPTSNYVAHLDGTGQVDTFFGSKGVVTFGAPSTQFAGKSDLGIALDPSGNLILKDSFSGNPDFDPGPGVTKLLTASGHGVTGGGFLLSLDPNAVNSSQSLKILTGSPEGHDIFAIVTLTGPGYLHVSERQNDGAGSSIDTIELFNTTLASSLSVKVTDPLDFVGIGHIITHDAAQNVGSIVLSSATDLGDPFNTGVPTILVTGKVNNLVLGDVESGSLIKLGQDLPYNIATDTTTPDTYNNHPNLTVGNIRGDGVLIDVTGDGTAGGVGGGGFGKVVIGSWQGVGTLRTTQSIGSFTVLQGDFGATLEVDKFHLGENTTADVGSMTIQNGAWGSSGTDVEGAIGSFDADAFLAGASITAASIGKVTTDTGNFDGTLTLTDTQAKGVATFTVNTDFTGHVISAAPLKKIVIKGDFMGSLSAPSIASISAFSFVGTTAGDGEGDPNRFNITTTAGLLGLIQAKSGIIKDYELTTPGDFSGMKVVLGKLNASTVGIENVNIAAANIGPITVQLSANAKAAGVDLTGIQNSSFSSDGKLGTINVKLSGASGASLGLNNASFAGASLGNVLVNVSKGTAMGATAQAVNDAQLTSGGNIGVISILGDATMIQATDLNVFADGKISALTVKSKTAAFGALTQSSVLAGQGFNTANISDKKSLTAALVAASLGPVNIGGAVTGDVIAAGGTLGVVNIGGDMSLTTVLAGANLGGDRALGGGDDFFHRAGQIASIVVRGAFSQSTIAAGVTATDAAFGNADDVAGAAIGTLTTTSAIKSITLGGATVAATPPANAHTYAIESQTIGKLTIAGQKVDLTLLPLLLDGDPASEGTEDVVVKLI